MRAVLKILINLFRVFLPFAMLLFCEYLYFFQEKANQNVQVNSYDLSIKIKYKYELDKAIKKMCFDK